MFGIGANELVLILLFGFLIFGPDKLPAMAKTIGKAIAKFKNAQNEMNQVIKNEVFDPTAEDPFKNPLDAAAKLEKAAKKEDRQESFTERKARYDKQRAAKKRAEERRAELAAKKAEREAAKAAEAAPASSKDNAVAAAAGAAAKATDDAASKPAAKTPAGAVSKPPAKPKPKVSADELYGNATAKKPAAKKLATQDADTEKAPEASASSAATEEKGE
ncbi:MAG: twin-arginine translocase TatA/TatE family subunit [Eggerthellaceae bacterium]|nr:twin-arginine translocase TatA/TatE family subunit [Eggerthellaceae bacterium]